MKKTIKNYCFDATDAKLEELNEVAIKYAKVKNEIFKRFSSVEGLSYLAYPREVRDMWVENEYGSSFGMPARLWKQALEEAFSNIKSNWSNAINKLKEALNRNKDFTDDEKYYIRFVLKSWIHIKYALTGQGIDIPDKMWKKIENKHIKTSKCLKYIATRLRRHIGKKPHQNKARSFLLDDCMYDFKYDKSGDLWIGIMGLRKCHRIHLRLTSKVIPEDMAKTIRLVINLGRIEIHQTTEVVTIANNSGDPVGVDKGYSRMIASSSGKFYGENLGDMQTIESDRLSEKHKKRNKLRDLAKQYEAEGNTEKANNIWKNNLGTLKYYHQKEKEKRKIIDYINTCLNRFFMDEKPSTLVVERLTFTYSSKKRKMRKKTKMNVSSWMKGILQKALELKAKENGNLLVLVNPAYTSQICHLCGRFGDRNGDKFHCDFHGVLDADYNAAMNILARLNDPEITLFTGYHDVRIILQERLRLSNQDSCLTA